MKKKIILVMTPLMLLTPTLVGCKSSTSEFTVKFDTDGGTQIADVKVKKGEKVTRPETDPSKEGYTFDDWYTTKEGNDRFDFDSTINADITIYAHYDAIPKKFTVKFDTDGGSAIDDVVVNEGEKVTRPANNPTKNKFVFDDWYTTRAAETKFDFDKIITANTTIFAKWNAVGLDRIEATLKVSKEYYVDDEISKDDIKVTAIYNDQSTKEITDWTCDDFDSYGYYYFEAKGTKKLAINYNGKITSLSIDVGEQTTPYWSNYLEISALSTTEIIVNKKDNPTFPSSGEVKIPRYVRGKHIQHDQSVTLESETRYAVNVVKENAFDSCSLITSVVLPVSIKTINEHAFCKTGITTIEIPSETTYIGANIFESCEALKSVTFKDLENYWFDESTYLNWQPSSDEELNLEILNYQGGSTKNEVAIENASPYLEKDKTTTMTVDVSEEDPVE